MKVIEVFNKYVIIKISFDFLMHANTPEETRKVAPTPEIISKMTSPLVIKSHLPFYLLHPKLLDTSKVISIVNFIDAKVTIYNNNDLSFPGGLRR